MGFRVFKGVYNIKLGLHGKHEEDAVQSSMRHLRLDVPISFVPISGCEEPYPILKCSDFLAYIAEFNHWDKLLGVGVRTLKDAEPRLLDFWGKYEQLYPNFPVYAHARENNISLSRIIPIYVHGDEGTFFKRGAVMILQWQSCIGAGTTLNSVDPRLWGNVAGKQYGANMLGLTLCTRLLFGVLAKATR